MEAHLDSNASTPTAAYAPSSRTRGGGGMGKTTMNTLERKQDVAERIGITRPRPPP